MVLTTVLLLLAALVLVGLVWGVLRIEHVDENERFHRARQITTSWAEPGPRFQTVPDIDLSDRSDRRDVEQDQAPQRS